MTYSLVIDPATGGTRTDVVSRDSDGRYVPTSTDCLPLSLDDAEAYQAWLAAGNQPAPAPAPAVTVTGNQFAFALKTLKLASAWRKASLLASDSDQIRLGLIARATTLDPGDPLLVRVAALAGFVADGNGNPTGTPVIDIPTVMAAALGMPL